MSKDHLINLGHEEELVNLVLEGRADKDGFWDAMGAVGGGYELHNKGMIHLFAGII